MDRLKGIFISSLVVFIVFGTFFSAYSLALAPYSWAWLGNLLSFGVGSIYFGGIYLITTPRTSKNMWATWLPLLLGTLLVIYATFDATSNYLPLALNLFMLAGWFLYTYWATDFSGRDKKLLQVGMPMPNITLTNLEGNEVSIDSFLGAPAILLFYRGNWCPFCMAQIKELAQEYQQIQAKGAALVFISPQSPKHTKYLAQKFDIPAVFLRDQDLKAATQLNLFHQNGTPTGMEVLGFQSDNVLPTLILLDAQGIIRFVDLTDNYRLRPEPSLYLDLLANLT
ncbi:peroxiredoxin family protein [Aureispira anguillae]|uniref:Peroxiredoxin family protein n=1 Tax=Aureispira anguillae TaxID=2864201 RepID=A0A915YB62_9BACT|nr:peroxiredoxin family protein [Aureispira anguillae]BDS09854.1 peroxiredoxin family protein [Aureispira anguillae]